MNLRSPVGWSSLQHEQQPSGVAVVIMELMAQPLDGRAGAGPAARSRIGLVEVTAAAENVDAVQ